MRLCANGDGLRVHARGLCSNCYQRARYVDNLPALSDPGERTWPGFAVSRYVWNGFRGNDLPAVWALVRRLTGDEL